MSYYVRHFFNPDFSHEKLRPDELKDGNVSQYYLGYVQNVVAGQVLAEVIDLTERPAYPNPDPRYIFPERVFPCGPNCEPHPDFPERILAKTNGYVFYNQGLITVKRLLNVRRDVDFHTGNIMFTGDIVAHGAIRGGFLLRGDNVLVKGTMEGASVFTEGDMVCQSGVKGGENGLLRCGGNVKMPFCENMRIHARGNVEIEGSCLHSELYVNGSIMIKGRLQGGAVCADNLVYVKEQLGGGQNTVTRIILGYDPEKLFALHNLERDINSLQTALSQLEYMLRKKPYLAKDFSLNLRLLQEKLRIKQKKRDLLWLSFRSRDESAQHCRIICPGRIRPGLEISITKAYIALHEYMEGLEFHLENDEIVYKPLAK